MDKQQAEILYDSGKKLTVEKLLEQDDKIALLKQKIASLTKDLTNSSKPPSSDGPQVKKQGKTPSNRNPFEFPACLMEAAFKGENLRCRKPQPRKPHSRRSTASFSSCKRNNR